MQYTTVPTGEYFCGLEGRIEAWRRIAPEQLTSQGLHLSVVVKSPCPKPLLHQVQNKDFETNTLSKAALPYGKGKPRGLLPGLLHYRVNMRGTTQLHI